MSRLPSVRRARARARSHFHKSGEGRAKDSQPEPQPLSLSLSRGAATKESSVFPPLLFTAPEQICSLLSLLSHFLTHHPSTPPLDSTPLSSYSTLHPRLCCRRGRVVGSSCGRRVGLVINTRGVACVVVGGGSNCEMSRVPWEGSSA